MGRKKLLLACLLWATIPLHAQWAHLFHKKITKDESIRAAKQNCFYFTKNEVAPFTQLLLSWNAVRPEKGKFTFFVQAKDAKKNRWGSWHRMIEWGNSVQRSYATQSDGFSKYLHVRLETEGLHKAQAFRIKVTAQEGASISLLKSIAVTTADMQAFQPEQIAHNLTGLGSVFVPGVAKISQHALAHVDNHRICSPVSCTILSEFFTRNKTNPLLFAHNSYDKGLNTYGSWPFNMAHSFEQANGKAWFFNTRLNSFKELHTQLRRGIPAIVSVRGVLKQAPQPYPNGHLLTVVGYDARLKEVLCHDSAKMGHENVEQRYSLTDFIRAWEASRRLTYWAERA